MQIDPALLDLATKFGPWGIVIFIAYMLLKNGGSKLPNITPAPATPNVIPTAPLVSSTGLPTSIDATGRPLVDLLAAAIAAALDARGVPRLPLKLPFGDLPPGDSSTPQTRVDSLKAARDEYEMFRQHFLGQPKT